MPSEDAIIHICVVVFLALAETSKWKEIKRKSQRKYQINFSHFIKLELKKSQGSEYNVYLKKHIHILVYTLYIFCFEIMNTSFIFVVILAVGKMLSCLKEYCFLFILPPFATIYHMTLYFAFFYNNVCCLVTHKYIHSKRICTS